MPVYEATYPALISLRIEADDPDQARGFVVQALDVALEGLSLSQHFPAKEGTWNERIYLKCPPDKSGPEPNWVEIEKL